MKRTRCVALACAVAVASMAQAQSPVLAYSWFDAGMAYGRIGSVTGLSLDDLLNAGNRLGLRGLESWGSDHAIYYGEYHGEPRRTDYGRLANPFRISVAAGNGISYGAMYAPIENSGNAWSADVRYAHGAFGAGLAYTRLRHSAGVAALYPYPATGVTALPGPTVAIVNPLTGAVAGFYAAGPLAMESRTVLAASAQWKAGSIALIGNAAAGGFKGYGRESPMRAFEVGGIAQLSPAWMSAIGYQHTSFEDAGWHQLTAGVAYSPSNWGAIYLSGDYVQASGNSQSAAGFGSMLPGASRQADIRMGMRLKF